MTQAFIFDFDGTLVDSEQAIYHCFQSITKQLAPNRVECAKNILIGPPLRDTASEILGPEHQDSLDEFVQLFIQIHDEQVLQHTKPYPGVKEILTEFSEKKIAMAIATNKRYDPTMKLINYFGWQNFFKTVECSNSQKKIRNKYDMIQEILNNHQDFNMPYYVGDTVNDGQSANLNQLLFIKANYGYGKKQDWFGVDVYLNINNFFEIKNLLTFK